MHCSHATTPAQSTRPPIHPSSSTSMCQPADASSAVPPSPTKSLSHRGNLHEQGRGQDDRLPLWGRRSDVHRCDIHGVRSVLLHRRDTVSLHLSSLAPSSLALSFHRPGFGFPDLSPRFRRKCLSTLCKICGRQSLPPSSLQIPVCYNRSDIALYSGGFADVWMGDHQGRKVAVKVLRVYSTSDFEKITSVGCLHNLSNHPCWRAD